MSAAEAFKLGRVNKVKLMIGVGRDEFNGGIYTNTPGLPPVVAETPAQYRQLVQPAVRIARADRDAALSAAAVPETPAPFIAYRTIMADAFSVCPALVS